MGYIGRVIKIIRLKNKMSRNELSKGICSEKYIYLIEKNERTPSSEITRLLGSRLNVDLFKYYEYLDCQSPVKVCYYLKKFKRFRKENNQLELKKITKKALSLQDFKNEPWSYEISLNELTYSVLEENKVKESIVKIKKIIDKMPSAYSNDICTWNFYLLLSISYQMDDKIKESEKVFAYLNTLIKSKSQVYRYHQVFISTMINEFFLLLEKKEYLQLINKGNYLYNYQKYMTVYERLHFTYFILAVSYYKTGQIELGVKWFRKMLYLLLAVDKTKDTLYLRMVPEFNELMASNIISNDLKVNFYKKYE